MIEYVYYGVAFLVLLVVYLFGVRNGKKYATRKVALEFQKVVHRLLHYAATSDYKNLHLMLHDLVSDDVSAEYSESQPDTTLDPADDLRKMTRDIDPES